MSRKGESPVKLFEDAAVDRQFGRMQWRMLFATMIGYTLFYFMRKNFSFEMPQSCWSPGIAKEKFFRMK